MYYLYINIPLYFMFLYILKIYILKFCDIHVTYIQGWAKVGKNSVTKYA